MNYKAASLFAMAGSLAFLTDASQAADSTRYFSGSFCQGRSSGDTTAISRDTFGCYNDIVTCPSNVYVALPIYWKDTTASSKINYQRAKVTYYKTNNQTLSCIIRTRAYGSGTVLSSSPLSVSTPPAGGWGVLDWDNTTNKVLPNSGNDISPESQQHIECTVPGTEYDNVCYGRNYIVGYEVTSVDY